jgi:hypothetical protein
MPTRSGSRPSQRRSWAGSSNHGKEFRDFEEEVIEKMEKRVTKEGIYACKLLDITRGAVA